MLLSEGSIPFLAKPSELDERCERAEKEERDALLMLGVGDFLVLLRDTSVLASLWLWPEVFGVAAVDNRSASMM